MHTLGNTRSAIRSTHLLHTPDTFVRIVLPGMRGGVAIVHVSPELGAAFFQYTAELDVQGTLGQTQEQRFIFVIAGDIAISLDDKEANLGPGGYAYLPSGSAPMLHARTVSRLIVIEKPYQSIPGVSAPPPIISHEQEVESKPLMGDNDLQVRALLPETEPFDFAVNTMEYLPGAALPLVEVHVMEHGLFMMQGGGIYRLADEWYPVIAGDFIWMSPYCPQWFGALGKTPAKYLIYKNWIRRA